MCTYHGWTYDLEGKLIGVPGYKNFYHEDLKREEWGGFGGVADLGSRSRLDTPSGSTHSETEA